MAEPVDAPAMRVSDADRWALDAHLQQAVGDGSLTLPEYDERVRLAYAARTRVELDALVGDLPAERVRPAPVPAVRRSRARRSVAVMSEDELRGPVAAGQGVEAYAVMGASVVDLRREDLPAEVRVRAVAVMGSIEVLVPRGVEVRLTGLSLMGGRELKLDEPRPGAPVLHVSGWALMGAVEVSHGRDGKAVQAVAVKPGVPSTPPTSTAAAVRAPDRAHQRSRLSRAVIGVAVAAGVLAAGYGVSQLEGGSVLGSNVVRVGPAESDVDVGSVFGSTTVVVEDGTTVTSGGFVILGSTECDACGQSGQSGRSVDVDGFGALGSIEIVTESQHRSDDEDDG